MTQSYLPSEDEAYADKLGQLSELWERYSSVTKDPQDLRRYMENGGDSAGLEKFVIETIKSGKVKKTRSGKHRPDKYRDIQIFCAAEKSRIGKDPETGKRLTKDEAVSKIAEERGINEATAINQYDRGRDLLFSGKGKRIKTELGKFLMP